MTTISNIEDFLRIVREDEALRSAVRRELLTEELLDLPARVAAMSKTQDAMLKIQNSILEDLADLRRTQDSMLKTQNSILEELADLRQTQNSILERLDRVEVDTKQNTTHIGDMKGLFMERIARDDASIIASDMGLRWQKTLERSEVGAIADEAQRNDLVAGISRDNMRRFRRADLVVEATDRDGESYYVAVEVSYTADDRDTVRATRHAEYLTRFTGVPAYAAIASVYIDNRIEDVLTEDIPQPLGVSGETKVFWSRLPDLESPS